MGNDAFFATNFVLVPINSLSQGPISQGPRSQGPRSRVSGPGSQVLILDYATSSPGSQVLILDYDLLMVISMK